MRIASRVWLPIGLVALMAYGLAAQDSTVRQRAKTAKQADHHHEATKAEAVRHAVAVLFPTEGNEARGVVHFVQRGEAIEITGEIRGLEPGKHGFHVHQYGDLTDMEKGQSAGGHFNPAGEPHGRPDEEERHVGDLGNIEANQQGIAKIQIRDTHLKLNGAHSILGRALVVHGGEDKFTQPSGDAGPRAGLGVIGIAQPQKTREARTE